MTPAGPKLRVELLGSFAVRVDGVAVEAGRWRLRKARLLLAVLALAPGQRRSRDQVLDLLWPDLDPAAGARNLHQTLYVARRTLSGLGAAGDGLLTIRDEQVVLDGEGPVPVDVLEFEHSAAAALATSDEAGLRAAAELYRGDLVPDLLDADWWSARRDEVRATHREVLVRLAACVQARAPEEASVLLARVLESDPLHEGAVRGLMAVLAQTGRRSEALARYERLADGLLEAFGTDPDPQTVAAFRELLTGAPAGGPARPGPDGRRRTGRLPRPLTALLGRERELVDVGRLLDRARLLTLTGAGGSGKTRLALAAARHARPGYPDGVWFVDLAAVGESLQVPDAVAEALELDRGGGGSREQTLLRQLRDQSLLVVLDNCEHLLGACTRLVTALLERCPAVDVLATSREPLHVHGEYTFRVPSLALPAPVRGDRPDLGALGRQPSIRLFVERAGQVRPGFGLDAGNARAVVDLCRRLDGLPLALELAAARANLLEPAEIVQRLGDALTLLGGGPDGVTRHQTLRGTLEWSHDLLGGPERVLFRRLAVFSGGFTLAAVEAVCADPQLPRSELLDLLAALVDKSLVVAEKTPAGTRYRQLETVRQFGGEKLEGAGETASLAAAHCAFFLAFAVAHNPERTIGVVREQPRLLDREHDNLRAALRWSCVHDPETALRLVASLWRFWFVRGHAVEGARWVERALAVAPEPTRPRAAALVGLTGLDSRQGRGDRHRALGAEALAIVRQIGQPDEVMMARLIDVALAWGTFDLEEAERLATEVHAEALAGGRPEHAAAGSWLLGQCALSHEDGALAADRLARCLSELDSSDPAIPPFLPVLTPSVQLVPVAGRLVPCVEETLLTGRRVGVRQASGYVLSALGDAARLSADSRAAISAVTQSVERFTELDDDLGRAQVLHQLGCLYRDAGDARAAVVALTSARDLRVGLGDRRGQLLSEVNLALLHATSGDLDHGLAAARQCLSGFEPAGDEVAVGAILSVLGAVELLRGESRAARQLYARAAEKLGPWRRHAGWSRLMVAELSLALGDPHRAEREAATARSIFGGTRCLVADRRLAALRQPAGAADDG